METNSVAEKADGWVGNGGTMTRISSIVDTIIAPRRGVGKGFRVCG